tara:strand:+ start:10686 stop:11690 length:1005 start_codon:yes stop_codon:yes gene_type:complete
MTDFISVIGTRPQIMKVDLTWNVNHKVIWTGQHHDHFMKKIFFDDMDIAGFDYELDTTDLVRMIQRIRTILKKEKPKAVIVYGDCRSTLAGAIAAHELDIHIIHVEAGMRCYRRDMPEERIRTIVDHLSTVFFCTDYNAVKNLESEKLRENIYVVGNTMFDSFNTFCPMTKSKDYKEYSYLSIHRQENADSKIRLENIFEGIESCDEKFKFPIHPRVLKMMNEFNIKLPDNVHAIKPLSYKRNLNLISNAKKVLTDSGGVQNEAYWMGVPCGILRRETEWKGFVEDGWSVLVDDDPIDIERFMKRKFSSTVSRPNMPKFGAKKKIKNILHEIYG